MGGYGAVTRQLRRFGCSRQTAYSHAAKVLDAIRQLDPRGCAQQRRGEQVRRLRRENSEPRARLARAVEFPLAKR